jgi:hypothetical protein
MDREAAMKGESARRNLLKHPTFHERAARAAAQEEAERRTVWYWAIGITFATAAALAVCFWVVVR